MKSSFFCFSTGLKSWEKSILSFRRSVSSESLCLACCLALASAAFMSDNLRRFCNSCSISTERSRLVRSLSFECSPRPCDRSRDLSRCLLSRDLLRLRRSRLLLLSLLLLPPLEL
uniref:(northern house mosquito) hypothetical protein n=2 Tax=Culex pipiens TaxID=7175 RepID=A0A8D8K1W7_CULPI